MRTLPDTWASITPPPSVWTRNVAPGSASMTAPVTKLLFVPLGPPMSREDRNGSAVEHCGDGTHGIMPIRRRQIAAICDDRARRKCAADRPFPILAWRRQLVRSFYRHVDPLHVRRHPAHPERPQRYFGALKAGQGGDERPQIGLRLSRGSLSEKPGVDVVRKHALVGRRDLQAAGVEIGRDRAERERELDGLRLLARLFTRQSNRKRPHVRFAEREHLHLGLGEDRELALRVRLVDNRLLRDAELRSSFGRRETFRQLAP